MEKYNRVATDVKLGKDTKLACFVNLYGCSVSDRTKVGAFVEIQKGASIGTDCKISSHTFICEGVTIGDRVFVGHGVTFINDRYPLSCNPDGQMKTDDNWETIPTIVKDDVSIGSGVTILCGVEIGEGAMIGAGSLVIKDIPAHEVWAGHPARKMRKVEKK